MSKQKTSPFNAINLANLAPKPYVLEEINKQNTPNKTIMVQGTTSDAGKSMLVTALCRLLVRKGYQVAPFKPQNMALNSAVTPCGGEIGRAQAVQAQAAKTPLQVHFNPILLKPQSDTCAQVIVQGSALSKMEAANYQDYKSKALEAVLSSHQQLKQNFDWIVVEGAGSPAEINLRTGDIANMGFAERVDCPVIIIADIDKGGVFAHLVGTLALLSESEQQRVIGFVINKFRGDISLLASGLDWLTQKTGKPVLGVLPYIHGLHLAEEDAVNREQNNATAKLTVIVPVYPSMSNHTDFDALRLHPEINLEFVYASQVKQTRLPAADLILLAGSKNVIQDLAFLRSQGWDKDIARHVRFGGKVFGICGGYQMLGQSISDPLAVEADHASKVNALGYLPITTELKTQKILANINATLQLANHTASVSGYEIHAGVSRLVQDNIEPIIVKADGIDGAQSIDKQVAGCYLHGLFDQADAITLLTKWLGIALTTAPDLIDIQEQAIETLADVCQQHLDLEQIITNAQQWRNSK